MGRISGISVISAALARVRKLPNAAWKHCTSDSKYVLQVYARVPAALLTLIPVIRFGASVEAGAR
jgi:hypothetical protein